MENSNLGKVFISYSHDNAEHIKRVVELSNNLRADGIDCEIDQYVNSPPEGWPRWMEKQIEISTKVILVCTRNYYNRVMGLEKEGEGLGVKWEGNLIYQEIYNAGSNNTKFVPIVFSNEDIKHIPKPLQGSTFYCIESKENYEELYWGLRGKSKAEKPKLGKLKSLPKKEIKTNPIMFLSGPINVELWDQAQWKGLYYEIYPDRQPLLGLIFLNEIAGITIFNKWQERYGKKDTFEELRVSIIEGDIPAEDQGYSIHIGSDLEGITNRFKSQGFFFNPELVTLISRVHRMNPPSNSKNLYYFKKAFNEYKSYFLVPCKVNSTTKKVIPIYKFGIYKEKIQFRNASEIKKTDIDRVVFKE